MRKRTKKPKHSSCIKTHTTYPIRVLYKKVGQTPEVRIIHDVRKLKKAIVQRNLSIIPYENLFLICHNKRASSHMLVNIFLPFHRILGDFIVINIDKKKRELKGLSQEDIIWASQDLIRKEPIHKSNIVEQCVPSKKKPSSPSFERDWDNTRYQVPSTFEKTLISVLVNLELVLASILKQNGDMKNE